MSSLTINWTTIALASMSKSDALSVQASPENVVDIYVRPVGDTDYAILPPGGVVRYSFQKSSVGIEARTASGTASAMAFEGAVAFANNDVGTVGTIAALTDITNPILSTIDGVVYTDGKNGVDPIFSAVVCITPAHKELHEGEHYICRSYLPIVKNGTASVLIVTPAGTRWGHMVIGFDMIGSTTVVELYEGVTTSNDGAAVTSRNRNRNVADDNTIDIYHTPTVSGGAVAGNVLQDGIFGAGRNSFGGGARDNEELMLKPSTKYFLLFTEQNVEATSANYSLDWYEHTSDN